MGLPTNIKTLLSGDVVEWARIEFKETWDAESSLKTICAFANDIDNWGGGYLVVGVKEVNGRPISLNGIPLDKIDAYLKDLLNKCKLIQPEYMPITEVVDYEGKKFIIVWAPGGSVRPYSSPRICRKTIKSAFIISVKWQVRLRRRKKKFAICLRWQIIFPLMIELIIRQKSPI